MYAPSLHISRSRRIDVPGWYRCVRFIKIEEGSHPPRFCPGNEAFVAKTDVGVESLKAGDDLTTSLARSYLLPEDFVNILANAEEGGRVSEVLQHQAEHYEEESGWRLSILTKVAGYGVWLVTGTLLMVVIFRMYLSYFRMFDQIK